MSSKNVQELHVTKASDLDSNTGQTEGMVRMGAVVNKSSNMCASVMLAHPHSSSSIHHHGAQDTIVYALRGHGSIVFNNGQSRKDLSPGDFALIPAYTEHQEANEGDEEVEWIIHRSPGGEPVVENLQGWSGEKGA